MSEKRHTVAIVAPPFAGHLNPVIAIGKQLRSHGNEVYFITGIAKADLLRRLGFAVYTVCQSDPYAMERIANTDRPVSNHPWRLFQQLKQNLALLPEVRNEIAAIFKERRPDIVLADFCAPIAGSVADAMGIPWVTTIVTPFALETRTGTPSYMGGWCSPKHYGHQIRDRLGREAIRFTKNLFELVLRSSLRPLGLSVYRPDGSEAAYSPHAILGLGMDELEFDRDWPPVFKMIGPIVEHPEKAIAVPDLKEASGSRKLVLVTLGTHLLWAKRDLVNSMRPLMASFPEVWFVLSMGDPNRQSETPLEQGTNWSRYAYVPYDPCLDRFDAVVSHAGAGIVYSCIEKAKPSLVCPRDYDHFDYAQRVHEHKLGIRVSSLSSQKAKTALSSILSGYGAAELEQFAKAFRRYKPHQTCIDTLESILSYHGSSP